MPGAYSAECFGPKQHIDWMTCLNILVDTVAFSLLIRRV